MIGSSFHCRFEVGSDSGDKTPLDGTKLEGRLRKVTCSESYHREPKILPDGPSWLTLPHPVRMMMANDGTLL